MWIAAEGCIGTGKTTLARLLAEHHAATALLEETTKHPFIAEFYVDPQTYAFETEMNFVLIHYHQLRRAWNQGLFTHTVFSDFTFDKDLLFADLTLKDPDEHRLFSLTYEFLKQRLPRPDLLICLRARTEFLAERIRKRGREFEAKIPFDYLDCVNAKYNEFFDSYDQSEKVVFDAQGLHVEEAGSALERALIERVMPVLGQFIDSRAES
jgi:deoxyguanosine kinase